MRDSPERLSIREWRDKRLLTQSELGAKIGVTFYTISNWELGVKKPRVRNLRALAEALGVQPEQIILTQGKERPVAA